MGGTLSIDHRPVNFENRTNQNHDEHEQLGPEEKRMRRVRFSTSEDNVWHRTGTTATYPSVIQDFARGLPGNSVLHNIMTPSLSICTKLPLQTTLSASIVSSSVKGESGNNIGVLCASKSFQSGRMEVGANTNGSLNASANFKPFPSLCFDGKIDSGGSGYVGCHMFSEGNNVYDIWFGSRLQFESQSKFATASDIAAKKVGGHVAVRLPSCALGVEAITSVKTLHPEVSYHFFADLAKAEEDATSLSLQISPEARSAVTLNHQRKDGTIAWAIEMEKEATQNLPNFKMGLDCVVNSRVTARVMATSSKLTGAVAIKPFNDQKVTCSFIFGLESGNIGIHGIGFEVGG